MMEGSDRKKTREEKPGVSKNYGAIQSYRNTLDYDSLRIIFQYLDGRDLGSAAMVCRSWSEAANNEKLIRGPYCFFILLYNLDTGRSDDTGQFLYNIKNIRIKPSVGWFFLNRRSAHIRNIIEYLPLPDHCETIMLHGDRTILDNDDGHYIGSGIIIRNLCPSVVCAFLPQIPNVRIKSFQLANHMVIHKSAEYQEIIRTIVDHGTSNEISNNETCVMLFCNNEGKVIANRWASAMQKSKEFKMASVWGGILYDIRVQRIHKSKKTLIKAAPHEPHCVAVLITGFIQTWLTILDRKCDTEEQVEARLRLFKDKVKLKKHSIGFMFAYRARRSNPESVIFKRLFPKVPLAGCFGSGVFGKTTTIDEVNEEKNDEEEPKCKTSWYNKGSTVFLILTYG